MATYSTNEFRPGLKVLLEGDPCSIVESEFFKPGKGQAMTKVKLRNLKTGRIWERTFRSSETIEAAEVLSIDADYLYSDGEFWHFMKRDDSYEQLAIPKDVVGETSKWLKEQDVAEVTLWNDSPILVEASNFVELEVAEAEPAVKGDTAQGAVKPVTLATGAVVKAPLFVTVGDVLRINTRTGEYQGRVRG